MGSSGSWQTVAKVIDLIELGLAEPFLVKHHEIVSILGVGSLVSAVEVGELEHAGDDLLIAPAVICDC